MVPNERCLQKNYRTSCGKTEVLSPKASFYLFLASIGVEIGFFVAVKFGVNPISLGRNRKPAGLNGRKILKIGCQDGTCLLLL